MQKAIEDVKWSDEFKQRLSVLRADVRAAQVQFRRAQSAVTRAEDALYEARQNEDIARKKMRDAENALGDEIVGTLGRDSVKTTPFMEVGREPKKPRRRKSEVSPCP